MQRKIQILVAYFMGVSAGILATIAYQRGAREARKKQLGVILPGWEKD